MADEQEPWILHEPWSKKCGQETKRQFVLQALQKAEGVCRIPHLS